MNYSSFRKKKQNKFIMWCVMAVAVLGIGVVVFFVSKAVEENKGYRTIGVVETKGTVTVVKDGIDYKAYPGMHLQEGQVLVTAGESSVRLVLDGDKYIKVEGGSRVVFETLGFLGSGKTKIILERGSMTGELVNPLETGQEFVVNTPNAVLAVRGTFFRVALENYGRTEVRTNVLTYGGAVASRRIFPTGETEEEEVLVESGYKTAIHMNPEDTFYVLEKTEGAKDTTGDSNNDIEPIYREDIADDDWVDIYYSAENGHELFVTVQEAKEEIENRNISLENTAPIYEKATEVFPEADETTSSGGETVEQILSVLPDDSKVLAMAEVKGDTNVEDSLGNNINVEEQELQSGLLTDGIGKESIVEESTVEEDVESTEETPAAEENVEEEPKEDTDKAESEVGGVAGSETMEPDSEVNEDTGNEEDTGTNEETGSEENAGGSQDSGNSGTSGGSTGNTGSGSAGTGSGSGSGETHTHSEVFVGDTNVHSMCSVCGDTLVTTHTYDVEVITVEPTCEGKGKKELQCECGYFITEDVPATGHNYISSEVTIEPTCTNVGEMTYTCDCGDSYTEEIPTVGHSYVTTLNAPTDTQDGSKYDSCDACGAVANEEIIWGINLLNFPDEAFRNYVESTYNTDGEIGLCETEVAAATSMTITADVAAENLYGIELFTSLETLVVESDYVQEIDVSSNAVLSILNANGLSELTTINAAYCSAMYSLSAENCEKLTKVDASYSSISTAYFNGSANLTSLNLAYARQLQRLQLMNCTGLTRNVSADVHSADITECGISSQDGYLIIKVTGTEIESRYSEVFGTTCVYGSAGYSYQGFEP